MSDPSSEMIRDDLQGRPKLLFICARNKIRSLTAERMFTGSPCYDVKSRGLTSNARIRLSEADLRWADQIYVMEKNHKVRVMRDFKTALAGKKVICLFIEDIYQPMEEKLVIILRQKLAAHLALPE